MTKLPLMNAINMVHAWTQHRVLFHLRDLRTHSQSSLVLICPNSKGLCVVEVADGEALLAEGETCFPEQPEPEHTTLFFSGPSPPWNENLKSYLQGLSLTGCVLCLLSFHCVLFTSGLHFIGVIEPQPLSVRDLQSTLSLQAGRPAALRMQAPPLSSAFSVPRPTQLMGRPFCNERR